MPNTTNISFPLKGMNQDLHPANLSEQGYDFSLNSVVEEFNGNGFPLLQNEQSTLHCTNFPQDYRVIGFVNITEQDRKILFLTNPFNGLSQIGEILGYDAQCDDTLEDGENLIRCATCGDDLIPESSPLEGRTISDCCTYIPIVISDCLNFDVNNPIRAIYRLEDCQISIFFSDNLNPYRYIQFEYNSDDPSQALILRNLFRIITGFHDEPCEYPIYGDLDCNKTLIDPIANPLCIRFIDVLQGGELKAGTYQFVASYADKGGNKRSPYFPATNPIPIFVRQITFDTDYRSERSIKIEVNNLDVTAPFEYYNIAVIKTINSVKSFEFVGTFPISQSSVLYTGTEKSLRDLTENDIFEQKVYYGRSKYIAQSNGYLFHSALEETKKLNVQRIANNISLQWQTVAIPEPAYSNPRFTNLYRSYMRDEVYPFGIVFVYDNGEESVVGHIPGPSKEYFLDQYAINVDATISNNDVMVDPSCANETLNKRWQVYNTAQLISTNPTPSTSGDCETDRCYQLGDFAYWESTDRYPNDPIIWGDLCGLPIRHHKFPDCLISHIHDGLSSSKDFLDNNVVFPLGININHQSVLDAINTAITENVITTEDANRIVGYRIVRGNRFGNKSIIAKGLLYDSWSYIKDGITYFYPNYPYNDLHDDPYLTEDKATYDDHDDAEGPELEFRKAGRYTFHSPDTHFVSPELGGELKIETEEYGQSEGYFNQSEDQSKFKLLSTTSYLIALAGGIVSMLTLMEPERCLEYVIKSDVLITQDDSQVSSSTFNTGQDIQGTGATTIVTINAGGSIGSHSISNPDITEDHTQRNDGDFYDADTGANITTPVGLGEEWETKTVRTCTGKSWQYFNNPALSALYGAFIFAQNLFYRIGVALQETEIIVNLIKTMTPRLNYGIQYNSVGKYNNYVNVTNAGNKRRAIETYSYLKPERALINEATTTLATGASSIHFNNWHRETSVYLKADQTKPYFPDPSVADESRFIINCRNDNSCDFKNYDKLRFYKPISSYYVSIKRRLPDQYGQITNIDYIDIGNCIMFKDNIYTACKRAFFGGDTFINRFALKRKHSFFLQTRFGFQDDTDVKYSELGNVAYPRYYFDTTTGVAQELAAGEGLLDILLDPATALGRPKSYLDAKTDKFFYQNGRMYLYSYGIPYFLVESDINVDYRHGENLKEKDFYPHITDLDFWLQEKNVDPREDNYYFYNFTYSSQNKEHIYTQYPTNFEPSRMCRVSHPNRIIYSNGANWLTYKANDFYDFPLGSGFITGVDGIENDKVLVRSENTAQVFNAYNTIQTNADTIQVGTGGIFQSRPQEYAHTTLGYAGSQHNAILHTEYGHVWVDAKRGQVFNLSGQGLDEISKDGMKNWFKENLPFRLLKDFPINRDDLDNSFNNIGITLSFDKRFNRMLITKKDFRVIDSRVQYDTISKSFFIMNPSRTEVSLTDKRYFCDRSFTISYNFYLKAWTSFHSYHPNYYIDSNDYFVSGINSFPQASGSTTPSSLWLHNKTNKSYQVFYGILYPWVVQTITKASIDKNHLNSIEFGLDAIRYHNDFDPFYTTNITFNKAVVYTQNQNSGLLNLFYKDKSNLNALTTLPRANVDSTDIRITNADGIWRFNQFYDVVTSRRSNIPIWLNNCDNVDKHLNPITLNYQMPDLTKRRIRGEWAKVKLINDSDSNHKLIFKWLVNNEVKSFR